MAPVIMSTPCSLFALTSPESADAFCWACSFHAAPVVSDHNKRLPQRVAKAPANPRDLLRWAECPSAAKPAAAPSKL